MNRKILDEIMTEADKKLQDFGFECIESEWNQHDRILRLFVDKEGGVDMSACVDASKALEDWIYLDSCIKGAFNLEISSPGVERPIRRLQDYKKYLGSEVQVIVSKQEFGKNIIVGSVSAVSDDGQISFYDGSDTYTLPVSSIKKAHLVYNWDS